MRRAITTPCPVKTLNSQELEETFTEETTTHLDYTTAFKASYRNVRAKRAPPTCRNPATFLIHEDDNQIDTLTSRFEHNVKKPLARLSQPARRVPVIAARRPTNNSAQSTSHAKDAQNTERRHVVAPAGTSISSGDKCVKRSPTNRQAQRCASTFEKQTSPAQRHEKEGVTARRKTLYIPQEDTIQPTMWMGIFSPVKNIATNDAHDLTGIAAQMADKRKRKSSNFKSRPIRGPLQVNTMVQGTTFMVDQAGAPTGKENLPPDYTETVKGGSKPVPGDVDGERKRFLSKARLQNLARPKSSSTDSVSTIYEVGTSQKATSPRRVAWNAGPRTAPQSSIISRAESPVALRKLEKTEHDQIPVPTRFVRTSLTQTPDIIQPTALIEDIQNPAMYEENWLEQQEVAITQMINSLFDQARPQKELDEEVVRSHLLQKYNNPDNNVLYAKLQGALMYGSLSLTYESMLRAQSLVNDVGRKQKFLKFWLDNYDHTLLKIALEVVTARHFSQQKSLPSPSSRSASRASLARFIETSLLRHEEAHFKAAGTGSSVIDLGTKTILKSLMLVKALDMLKDGSTPMVQRSLFRGSAMLKTSANAAREVLSMLNPTVGDSLRSLRQLGYVVTHEQTELDNIDNHIENLATDFRDGINLTRLVEIMLYGTNNATSGAGAHTITTGENEDPLVAQSDLYPLTRHLKLSCASRAVKLQNTRIAMAALANIASLAPVIQDVTAEHLVDGFREKTMILLWALVSRFGLAGFVDREEIALEIRRLRIEQKRSNLTLLCEGHDQYIYEYLLKEWARNIAKSRGIQISNLSTSFSDGKVFEAILDEYEPYILTSADTINAMPLAQRLMRLGCSKQFSDLFSAHGRHLHVFGKEFVIAALAFLCSRVLGQSKLCRKAVVIQRCWRDYWSSVQGKRKVIKRELARACAAQVTAASRSFDPVGDEAAACQDSDIWLGI